MPVFDIQVENHGTIALAQPLTQDAAEWLFESAPEEAQFLGQALALEPRYVEGFANAAEESGYAVGYL